MKTHAGTLALVGAVLLGGSALAQTPPQQGASSTAPGARQASGPIPGAGSDADQASQGGISRYGRFSPIYRQGTASGGSLPNTPPTNDPDDNVAAEAITPATGTLPAGQGQEQSRSSSWTPVVPRPQEPPALRPRGAPAPVPSPAPVAPS